MPTHTKVVLPQYMPRHQKLEGHVVGGECKAWQQCAHQVCSQPGEYLWLWDIFKHTASQLCDSLSHNFLLFVVVIRCQQEGVASKGQHSPTPQASPPVLSGAPGPYSGATQGCPALPPLSLV